ncbi:methionyl-tRNA formyltransferase [Mycoplasma sp. CSL10137]|uniref:methionyl-tRNA formyltransferase n=1 Tax=unclassified Mycoplasma TaxID=2683645 RepID=UPI00197B7218|nr:MULTISPECIES: methionyl-tRNA formyltransferase [unclassified Mycoplasma]MBN4083546.1 methionyl-tRNA formyltransferase [Mycoplasma sp. CSL10137]MBN4084524.1 methionyl-tRNA formyltransferase [Mycoplasma sp. CSL10166]MBU4693002.1 methionyl-tRNA formyltransferase [Mycoplasma sp. CSL7491-lung]
MKIVLAGTPDFSVPIFEKIINNFDVVAIVSQPDKPNKRGNKVTPTPTKMLANKYNIKLFQPTKIKDIEQDLKDLEYDIFLTCAFGQYIPESVLKIAKLGSINIHGSILPKYRGAAPIQYSLLNGDKETGISLIFMDKIMDAGDIIFKAKIDISEFDTSDTLFKKISILAQEKIVDWLNKFEKNDFIIERQNNDLATLSPKLSKEDAFLDSSLTVEDAFNKIRAFSSNPGAYILLNEKRVKIFYAHNKKKHNNSLILKFKNGFLYATDYQFESKKRINLLQKTS